MKAAFSVILPFYRGDKPEHLSKALDSLKTQSLRADEIVLIQDGPVAKELKDIALAYLEKMPEIKLEVLEENQGLSGALNAGIEVARNEWLARMDADDICLENRFKEQWAAIEKNPDLALLGSWIEEYDEEMLRSTGFRKVPEHHSEIFSFAKWRCPFNHMTVMYRKSALDKLGKYQNFGAVGDDYELWARFLVNGYVVANIPEVLVKARSGDSMISNRRRGMKYLRHEIREINALYRLGLLKPWHYLFHFIGKSILRLAPAGLLRLFYHSLRNKS